MKKIINILMFTTLFNVLSYGQNVPFQGDSIFASKQIAVSEIVFEGKLLKSENYLIPLNEDRIVTNENYNEEQYGKFLISHTIQVTKVLKGVIMEGTIEIITEGGGMGNVFVEVHDGIGIGVHQGIGIFLCSPSKFKSIGKTFDNKVPLQVISRGISYATDIPMYRLGLSFSSPTDLYSFLQRQPNIVFKDFKIHPIIQEYFSRGKY